MSGFYHWDDERMVNLEMRELNRELAHLNLLREAGLSEGDWLRRAANAFLNLLRQKARGSQDQDSPDRQPYPSRREKATR